MRQRSCRRAAWLAALGLLLALPAAACGGRGGAPDGAGEAAASGSAAVAPAAARDAIRVPLWIDPNAVRHRTRFLFSFDPPAALAALRAEERLDEVLAGASGDLDRFRRLVAWTRARFEPGIPSPYPPFDARVVLRDIRAGVTGGFCAQYNCVLVQALQAYGIPARYVTVQDHEVAEAFDRETRRWICLDPLHAATYVDEAGRALSVHEIHERQRRGAPFLAGPGSLPSALSQAAGRFGSYAVWLRNDHVTRPINFTDIDRYKVHWMDDGTGPSGDDRLSTGRVEDLYFDPKAL